MQDYFEDQEYFIDHIWFHNGDCRYDGNGVMTWNPSNGFHIAARVKRSRPLPNKKDFNHFYISPRMLIRMKLSGGVIACVPTFRIDDIALMDGYFSHNVARVILIQHRQENSTSSCRFGSAIFETQTDLILPDTVRQEIKIGNLQPLWGLSRSGFEYENNSGQKVTGRLTDKRYLHLNWKLPKESWSKTDNWYYAEGLRDAISITSGNVIELRYHESYRCGRILKDIRVGQQPFSLGTLFRLFDTEILDKNTTIKLANFLTLRSKESDICRKMLYQITDASRQETWQAKQLLLSTILEAALRTLFKHPFVPGKPKKEDKFDVEQCLESFRKQYLPTTERGSQDWGKTITHVVEIRRRLRHRNAHPDWLSEQGGAYSKEEMECTFNDIIFLSRFYGYMILALAGFKELQPLFPKPISNWGPMMTLTTNA